MDRKLSALKAQKTKLLNKECNNEKEFEELQERLNEIELEITMYKNNK